jgi:hypothetical protein
MGVSIVKKESSQEDFREAALGFQKDGTLIANAQEMANVINAGLNKAYAQNNSLTAKPVANVVENDNRPAGPKR